ncbi:MAG: hypothetical protein QNJ51_29910 [Calothrix sp. MO_167.B12]|nr:hypothetical protein [Calothrix sp. MO_167.B12]
MKPNDSNGSVGLRYRFSQDAEGYTQPTTITNLKVVLVYILFSCKQTVILRRT